MDHIASGVELRQTGDVHLCPTGGAVVVVVVVGAVVVVVGTVVVVVGTVVVVVGTVVVVVGTVVVVVGTVVVVVVVGTVVVVVVVVGDTVDDGDVDVGEVVGDDDPPDGVQVTLATVGVTSTYSSGGLVHVTCFFVPAASGTAPDGTAPTGAGVTESSPDTADRICAAPQMIDGVTPLREAMSA